MIRQSIQFGFLVVFLAAIVFLFYEVPQILLLGLDFSDETKLALVLAGISLGVMFFLKDRSQSVNHIKPPDDSSEDDAPPPS